MNTHENMSDYTLSDLNFEKYKKPIYNEGNTEENREIVENFIENNPPHDDIFEFPISTKYMKRGKEIYYEMQNSENNRYADFASSGWGPRCYGLYKSKKQIIYIIVFYYQEPTHYIKIDISNERVFDI